MKRSEVIKLIDNILKNGYDNPSVTILMKLEDIGLIKPTHKSETLTELGVSFNEGFIAKGWEPEDE